MRRLGCFLGSLGVAGMAFGGVQLPDRHVPWTTSRIAGSPHPPAPYRVERVFPRVSFKNPVEVMREPGTDRFWCVELMGGLHVFDHAANPESRRVADLKRELPKFDRIFGFQFHPGYRTNRFLFLAYNTVNQQPDGSRISRFRVRDTNPPSLDVDSEQVIITWRSGGHNGCSLHFGPDGFLYFSTGDSEVPSPPDPLTTGQDIGDLLGSILRIDVDRTEGGRPYAVPPDNPFINTPGARPEVWAYGLRNPWRMSFDDATGELLVGDVGWELWEMIYRVVKGGNYGWSITEGPQPVRPDQPPGPTPIRPPLVSHSHVEAMSITGGYTWRHPRLPELDGHWIYGDYVTGKIWGLKHDADRVTAHRELVDSHLRVICFARTRDGEVLAVDYEGLLYRLERNPSAGDNRTFPRRLSETGLFTDTAQQIPAPGVLPYEISMEPWMDGATAQRFVGLPGDGRLDYHRRNDLAYGRIKDFYAFPTNGVLAKTIALNGRRLETQVLHFDGEDWHPYNYLWNESQTDAELADGKGASRRVDGLEWRFHSDTECMTCHMTRPGIVLGFHPQFTDVLTAINGQPERQQAAWNRLGITPGFSPLNQRWRDKEPAPQSRARNWLHVNCAHCHRQGGGGSAPFELRADLPPERFKLFDVQPNQGTFGLDPADIVRPGDPFHSVLLYRIAATGAAHMPRLGARTVDPDGVRLIRDWIAGLDVDKTAPKDNAPDHLPHDLTDTAEALHLATRLNAGRDTALIARLATRVAEMSPAVYDLLSRFLPDNARRQTLGDTIDTRSLLSLTGDVRSGEALFFDNPVLQCVNCHRLKNRGREVGPDLAQIGRRYTREQILESLVEPSRFIDPRYVAHDVETRDGESYTGFLLTREPDHIVLRDLSGKDHRWARAEVLHLTTGSLSLMPTGLLAGLTAQQAADLLAFLSSLR